MKRGREGPMFWEMREKKAAEKKKFKKRRAMNGTDKRKVLRPF